MPEENDAAQVEGNQTEEVSEQTQATEEEVFFDANMVPEPLRESYRQMQGAFTKKTQEIAPWRGLSKYGTADELGEFLEGLQSQEGLLGFWFDVADRLGLDREDLTALMAGGGEEENLLDENTFGTEEVEDGDDPPLTRSQFEQWLRSQEATRVEAEEDRLVQDTLEELGVKPEEERFVLAAAMQYPQNLGYTERLRRGYADFQEFTKNAISSAQQTRQEQLNNVPDDLGGEPGAEAPDGPQDFNEARRAAMRMMENLS